MWITKYRAFAKNLESYLNKIQDSSTCILVTMPKGEDVIVLSKSDYNSIQETIHLLKSPANANRLLKSIEDYNNGFGKERNLIED